MTYILFYFITHRLLKSFTHYMVKKSTNFIPHPIGSIYDFQASEVGKALVSFFYIRVRSFFVYICHPAVFYMPTGLAGCLVGPRISYGARKLTRTP
jgi:hypothetical protein